MVGLAVDRDIEFCWGQMEFGVFVGVLVGVLVGVFVGVLVGVFVGVLVGVFVGLDRTKLTADAAEATGIKWQYEGELTLNAQTGTTYTLVLTDSGKQVTMSNASASTLTVPPNASVAFAVGVKVQVIQLGAGAVTLTAGAGVTINSLSTSFILIFLFFIKIPVLAAAPDITFPDDPIRCYILFTKYFLVIHIVICRLLIINRRFLTLP